MIHDPPHGRDAVAAAVKFTALLAAVVLAVLALAIVVALASQPPKPNDGPCHVVTEGIPVPATQAKTGTDSASVRSGEPPRAYNGADLPVDGYQGRGPNDAVVGAEGAGARPPAPVLSPRVRALLDAMRPVESGGPGNCDDGRARGPYQIHRRYWLDAEMPDGTYADCDRVDYSERVIWRYWHRHARKAFASLDIQTLARRHNGGPHGDEKHATLAYWDKVRAVLAEGG